MITSLDSAGSAIARQALLATLIPFGEKNNVAVSCTKTVYARDGQYATFSIQLAIKNSRGVAETPERRHYLRDCSLFNLKPEWLGKTFEYRGQLVKVMGLNPRSYKYPISVMMNGKAYKFPAEIVQRGFTSK